MLRTRSAVIVSFCLQSLTSCFPILLLLPRSRPTSALSMLCYVTARAAPIKKSIFAQQPTWESLSELTGSQSCTLFVASVCFRSHCCHKQACLGRPWLRALSLSGAVTQAAAKSLVTTAHLFVIWPSRVPSPPVDCPFPRQRATCRTRKERLRQPAAGISLAAVETPFSALFGLPFHRVWVCSGLMPASAMFALSDLI